MYIHSVLHVLYCMYKLLQLHFSMLCITSFVHRPQVTWVTVHSLMHAAPINAAVPELSADCSLLSTVK